MNNARKSLAAFGVSRSAGAVPQAAGRSFMSFVISLIPWAIVGGLLYAGLFIKPHAVIEEVIPPAVDKRDFILGVAKVDDKNFWAAGNYGKVILTADKGKNWVMQETPVDVHLQDIDAWSATRAVAVGNKGKAIITSDGGETWREAETPKSEISNKLIRVHAYPNGEALAVGEMGAVLQTKDYGNSWKRLRDESDVFLNDIVRVDSKTLLIAAEANPDTGFARVIKTTDNGETWNEVYTDSPNSFMAIDCKEGGQECVTVGLAGAVAITKDGGESWEFVDQNVTGMQEHLMDVAWSENSNEWVAIGNKGKWMSISEDFTKFDTRNLSDKDFTSHSELELDGIGGFVAVGETEGYMNLKDKTWTMLHD